MGMRREIAVMSIALIAVVLISSIVLPWLDTLSRDLEQQIGGRKLYYSGVIRVKSSYGDDPWEVGAVTLASGSIVSYNVFVSYTVRRSDPVLCWVSDTPTSWAVSGRVNVTNNMVAEITIFATFSFSSNISTPIYLTYTGEYRYCSTAGYNRPLDYSMMTTGTSYTFTAATPYRWTIRIPWYSDANLTANPILILPPTWYVQIPLKAVCTYVDLNTLTMTEYAGDLGLSITRESTNSTHRRWYATITFGAFWNNQIVNSCSIYTDDTNVINAVNGYSNKVGSVTGGRLYIASVNLNNIQILQNDQLIIDIYVVTPSATPLG